MFEIYTVVLAVWRLYGLEHGTTYINSFGCLAKYFSHMQLCISILYTYNFVWISLHVASEVSTLPRCHITIPFRPFFFIFIF
ncbi:hypothetical protein Hanom_Chr00s000001g01594311 [Helianthus anomalus]